MTLKQLSELVELPESTARLYRDEFAEFIPVMGEGRRRRYDDSSVILMKRIAERKKSGIASATIRQELARVVTPQEKRRVATQDDRMTAIHVALESQNSEIAMLRVELGNLRNEIEKLVALIPSRMQTGPTMESVQRTQMASDSVQSS